MTSDGDPSVPFRSPSGPAPGGTGVPSSSPPPGPTAAPGAPSPYATSAAPSGPAGFLPPGVEESARRSRTALGWAIAGAVAGGLALVLSVVALLATLGPMVGAMAGDPEDGDYYGSLRGQVTGIGAGSPLSGDRLAYTVRTLLLEDGFPVDGLQCGDTPDVQVSTVVACTGAVDGYDWTGVVVFTDATGGFSLLEL